MSRDHTNASNAITEVELDAVDLVGLSPLAAPTAAQARTPSAAHAITVRMPTDEERSALGTLFARDEAQAALPNARRSLFGHRALGVFGLLLIASAAFVSHQLATSQEVSPRRTIAWTPLPEGGASLFAEEDAPEAAPTLFTNPFDPTEVFELPPGLSREEARERVAQILLERARERMASR